METLSSRRQKLSVFGPHMHPLVVIVGSIQLPTAAYVVVDNATWKVSSPLKAVDSCFKVFHVFHAVREQQEQKTVQYAVTEKLQVAGKLYCLLLQDLFQKTQTTSDCVL